MSWLSEAKLGRGHDVRKSQFSATVIYGKNSAIIKITSRGLLLHKLGRRGEGETFHAGNWHERKFQFKYKMSTKYRACVLSMLSSLAAVRSN